MSHTTTIGNFSVQSVDFSVPQGDTISSVQATAILTLVPDAGYELDSADFSYTSGPSEISSVVFSQDGDNVLATVTFNTSAIMPGNDLDLPICIDGQATAIPLNLSGNVRLRSNGNTTPVSGLTAYSGTGNPGDEITAFSYTLSADSGYYFDIAPNGFISVGNPANYNVTKSNSYDAEGYLTGVTFNGLFTFGTVDALNNEYTIDATAVEIPVYETFITAYTINTSNIDPDGESRTMTIYGDIGAQFSLTVVDQTANNIITPISNFIITSGAHTITIPFPSTSSNEQYDFVLTGDLASTFDTPSGQDSTFSINQYSDISVIYAAVSTNPDFTTPLPSVTYEYPAYDTTTHSFTFDLVVYSATPIIENVAPTASSFTNTDAATNGGVDINITNVSSALSNGDLTYTISVQGTVNSTEETDVISQINLDNFVATNAAPVGIEYVYYVDEDTPEILDLSNTFSDSDGDVLTITINSTPLHGTLYTDATKTTQLNANDSLPAGQFTVYYEPDLNYNSTDGGNESFQATASDGTTDSGLITILVVVASINDLPIIDSNLWETGGTATINGSSVSVPGGFNSYVFESGDSFSATASAVDIEDLSTELTWSLVSQSSVEGSGETTVPAWIIGTTNPDGTFTISSTSVVDGNYTFYIKVEDTDGGVDYQIVSVSGIVPTVNSYFKFYFDSSGSMNSTLGRLRRDLLGVNVANPYNDSTCLQYYLQDFYATGDTQANGNTDTATNGADEYAAKVSLLSSSSERIYDQLNNNANGFGQAQFPDAESVVIGVFSDESSGVYYNGTAGGTTVNTTCTADVTALETTITNLNSNSGNGFYRGIYFSVDDPTYGASQDDMWNASINGSGWATSINLTSVASNLTGTIGSGVGQTPIIDDGNATNGYYTQKVIEQLIALGYNIPAYGTTR